MKTIRITGQMVDVVVVPARSYGLRHTEGESRMSNEMAVTEQDKPLTATDIRMQVNLIQEVMKAVMIDGQHYGVIPGCGPKPTLLKPGAEKLMATFRLAVDPEVDDMSDEQCRRYRVIARVTAQSNARFLGAGVGECSSDEDKYSWREAVCREEWDDTDPCDRRDKWRKGKQGPFVVHQIRTNPADLANTILKMAKKRALVDAVLTVTAASDIFTQDIEDMPEEVLNKKPEVRREAEAADLPANSGGGQTPQASDVPPATSHQEKAINEALSYQSNQQADLEIVLKDLLREASQFKTVDEGNQILTRAAEIEGLSVQNMQMINKVVSSRMKVLKTR